MHYDPDDDIRRTYDGYLCPVEDHDLQQQIAILNSLKEKRPPRILRKPPTNTRPPPVPPRPQLSNTTRILIATTQRQSLIARYPQQNSNLISNDEYKRVLERSLVEYKQPFHGLSEPEKAILSGLVRSVDQKVIHAKKDCAICRESYQLAEKRTILPCMHDYHSTCINTWLADHNTCPFCKKNISKLLKKIFS
jgi:hypothetical protein